MISRRSMAAMLGAGGAGVLRLPGQPFQASREQVIERLMRPYAGPTRAGGAAGLEGRVFAGYQGWFTAPGDGSGKPWFHYGKGGVFEPGTCHIDYWPDMSECEADEKYETPFRHKDGSVAHVFSSMNRKTVLRHFRWMETYGIDGAFVQRFTAQVRGAQNLHHSTTVLAHCREGANRHGRAYAVMYDTPFDAASLATVLDDWRLLTEKMQITRDPAYLRHQGRPVLALWGFAFTHRAWDAPATAQLFRSLGDDIAIMLGVPTGWRTLDRDCRPEPGALKLLERAAIVSPWTVGRYRSPETARKHAAERWAPDLQWCNAKRVLYLPVVFPGFSWHNLKGKDAPLNQIPRTKSEFFHTQFEELKKSGPASVYVAMFDEMDEGTAIFKCTDNPPAGASPFLTYEGLPADAYLRMAGKGREYLKP